LAGHSRKRRLVAASHQRPPASCRVLLGPQHGAGRGSGIWKGVPMRLDEILLPAGVEHPRVGLFGFELDAIDMPTAVDTIYRWIASNEKNCRFIVTPNVDHA